MPAKKKTVAKKETTAKKEVVDRSMFGGDVRLKRAAMDRDGNVRAIRPQRNDESILNIYPGDVINKHAPEVDVQFGWGEISNSSHSAQHLLAMVRSGWKFCTADEWDLSPEFQIAMTTDAEGRIITKTLAGSGLCMMYRDAEAMDEADKRHRAYSAEIQQAYKDRMTQTIEEFSDVSGGRVTGWSD